MTNSKNIAFKKRSTAGIPEKTIISAQFVKLAEQLIGDRHFRDQEHFAMHYGYAKHLLSHIKAGRQDVTPELLYNVVLDWKINPYFIFGLDSVVYAE